MSYPAYRIGYIANWNCTYARRIGLKNELPKKMKKKKKKMQVEKQLGRAKKILCRGS